MDYRYIFGVFLAVLAVQAAPTDDFSTKDRHDISNGPMILNEEDRRALEIAAQQSKAALSSLADISHGPLALNDEDKQALNEVNKQNEKEPHLHDRHDISNGLMILNEEDRRALEIAAQKSKAALSSLADISHGPLALNDEDKQALNEVNKQNEKEPHLHTRDEISHGPLALNEEDKKALNAVNNEKDDKPLLHTRDEISQGPLALNDNDKKALSEVNKQSEETDTQHEISHGPLVLSEEDKKALLEINNQVNELNKENPGENAHGFLSRVLDSVKTVTDVVKRLMGKVKEHEEKSHNAIEKLRSSDPDTTDVCVRDIFGIPPIMNPVYCGVKYFSQVAMGLHELTQSVTPVKESVIKLRNDLAGCNGKAFGEKFVCTTQATRDAWDNSDYVRARLGQHLTLIRYLALDIARCIHNNHAVQSNLVSKVALCASASNK